MKKHKKVLNPNMDELLPLLIGVWRRFHKEAGPNDSLQTREFRRVVSGVKYFLKSHENRKSVSETNYFENPELLGAYLLYFWVLHYQQGLSIMGELPITPKRVLDICSGPAALSFAALRHGAQEVFATDKNMAALELGAEICGKSGYPISIRKWNCQHSPMPIEGRFDLIILGHCLEELFPNSEEQQNAFIHSLLNKLTQQGFLLIIENSDLETNYRVLRLRDHFVQAGIAVQAPCVWKGECPALKTGRSPCYAQREFEKPYLIKEIQRAANINLGSLKMSYIIFKSPQSTWPQIHSDTIFRVISPPFESLQGKRYYLCGTVGKRNIGSKLYPIPKESRAFDFLKRGELISIENAMEGHNSLDIISGTAIHIEAACGKPLPENGSDDD